MVSRVALDFNYGNLDAAASLMCVPPWQLFRRPAASAAGDVVKIQSMGS